VIALALLLACGTKDDAVDTDTAVTDSGTDTAEDTATDSGDSADTGVPSCGGAAPVIDGLLVENAGLQDLDGEGESPTVLLTISMSDEDEDLQPFQVDLWWDDVVDGVVDPATAELLTFEPYTLDGYAPCDVAAVNFGVNLEVDGGRYDYGASYEFAAVVTDAAGLASQPGLGLGVMPLEDGTDPVPEP
jgi:hypothetical protein